MLYVDDSFQKWNNIPLAANIVLLRNWKMNLIKYEDLSCENVTSYVCSNYNEDEWCINALHVVINHRNTYYSWYD